MGNRKSDAIDVCSARHEDLFLPRCKFERSSKSAYHLEAFGPQRRITRQDDVPPARQRPTAY